MLSTLSTETLDCAGAHYRGELVDRRSRSSTRTRSSSFDEIDLVENHAIGEGDLLDRLVLGALGLLLVQVLLDVLGIHEGDDAVEPRKLLTLSSTKKVCATGGGIGHARGLDQDAHRSSLPSGTSSEA